MKHYLALVLGALLFVNCGGSTPTTPSTSSTTTTATTTTTASVPAKIEGNYTLVITAASRCAFPISDYRWSVVAQVTDVIAGVTSSVIKLANGSTLLDMTIQRTESLGALTSITTLGQFGIPIENNTAYSFISSILGGNWGVVKTNTAGRAEVLDTPFGTGGSMSLARSNPYSFISGCPSGSSFGSWSLFAR